MAEEVSPAALGLKEDEPDYFDVWYMTGLTVFNKEVHGKLMISKKGLRLTDENEQTVFDVPASSVQNVKVSGYRQLLIKTQQEKYRVVFYNPRVAAFKQLTLGSLWGTGGQNGIFSPVAQEYCSYATASLENKHYTVIPTKPLSTKQGLLIVFATIVVIVVISFLFSL